MKIYYTATSFGKLTAKCPKGQDCCVGSIICKQCSHCYGAGHTPPFGYGKEMVVFAAKDPEHFELGWDNDWIKCAAIFNERYQQSRKMRFKKFVYHKFYIPLDKLRTMIIDNGIKDLYYKFISWFKS